MKAKPIHRIKARPRLRVHEQTIAGLADVFKLLADKSRLKILVALAQDGELHVTALCDLLTQSQPAVSHHLTLLRMRGLVGYRREGKHNYYFIDSPLVHQLLDQAGLCNGHHDGNGHRAVPAFRTKPR